MNLQNYNTLLQGVENALKKFDIELNVFGTHFTLVKGSIVLKVDTFEQLQDLVKLLEASCVKKVEPVESKFTEKTEPPKTTPKNAVDKAVALMKLASESIVRNNMSAEAQSALIKIRDAADIPVLGEFAMSVEQAIADKDIQLEDGKLGLTDKGKKCFSKLLDFFNELFNEYAYWDDGDATERELIELVGYWADKVGVLYVKNLLEELQELQHNQWCLANKKEEAPILGKLEKTKMPEVLKKTRVFLRTLAQQWNDIQGEEVDCFMNDVIDESGITTLDVLRQELLDFVKSNFVE